MLITRIKENHRKHLERIGERIQEARKEIGMSQLQLAEAIGTQASNISRIERGRQNLTISTLLMIADALGMEFSFSFVAKTSKDGH